jgi:predicted membrane-bound spermidine synthase
MPDARPAAAVSDSPASRGADDVRARTAVVAAIFFLSGSAALVYQIAWQRLLFTSFGVDIESVTIVVSTFMLGLGAGAMAGGALADRFPSRLLVLFAACELGIGLFGLASVPLIRALGDAFATSPRAVVAAVNFALLLVPTSLMGATLPILVTDAVRRQGGVGVSIGALYFVNTLGAASGALSLGLGLFAHLELPEAIAGAALINFTVASVGAWFAWRDR